MAKKSEDPANTIRAAGAAVGAYSLSDISNRTGIPKSTLCRKIKQIKTLTVGELAVLMKEFPSLSDEVVGKIIREAIN